MNEFFHKGLVYLKRNKWLSVYIVILLLILPLAAFIAGQQQNKSGYAAVIPLAMDVQVGKNQSTAANKIVSPTFSTHAGNELVVVSLASDGLVATPQSFASVSAGSLQFSLAKRANGQKGTSEVWFAYSPEKLTNVQVTATRQNGSYQGLMRVVTFTGARNVLGAAAGGSSATGAPSVSLITTVAGSMVLGVGNDPTRATGRTVGANQKLTQQYLATKSKQSFWTQQYNSVFPVVGTAVNLNDTQPTLDAWNMVAVEVLPMEVPVTATPTPTSSASATLVNFEDRAASALNGTYAGIDWGTNIWDVDGPVATNTTKSISFHSSALTSGTFAFINPSVLQSVGVYSNSMVTATVTFSCAGNPSVSIQVGANQTGSLTTGWTTPCTTVTVASSNGWNTNVDNLMYSSSAGSGVTPTVIPTATPTNGPTPTNIPAGNGSALNSRPNDGSGYWPDFSNTGYKHTPANAGGLGLPAYPGNLTDYAAGMSTSKLITATYPDNSVISYKHFLGDKVLIYGDNLTFVGCLFEGTKPDDNLIQIYSPHKIKFLYSTFKPNTLATPPGNDGTVSSSHTSPGTPFNQSWQYITTMQESVVTMDHNDIWGNAGLEMVTGFPGNPSTWTNNYIHDQSDTANSVYHHDGIGPQSEGNGGPMVIDHNTIASLGNTNGLALQGNGVYDNIKFTNNYVSGWGYALSIGITNNATNVTVTGNVFSAELKQLYGFLYGNLWGGTARGSTWRNNLFQVHSGDGNSSFSSTDNGKYSWPTDNNSHFTDYGG